jgi:purine-binding chemotaxis protein CheW
VTFDLGAQSYALPIAAVREVLPFIAVEPVPMAPPLVLGVINLRGRILTVIDLHRRLGIDTPAVEQAAAIVLETRGQMLALRIDRVRDMFALADAAIVRVPRAAGCGGDRVVFGLVKRAGEMLTLLDSDQLVQV